MCGIYGLILNDLERPRLSRDLKLLAKYSKKRGRDQSGIALLKGVAGGNQTYFDAVSGEPSSLFDQNSEYIEKFFKKAEGFGIAMGHCRLATHGLLEAKTNRQPIVIKAEDFAKIVGLHNGIIVNPMDVPSGPESDSVLMFNEIAKWEPANEDHLVELMKAKLSETVGSATIALAYRGAFEGVLLASNTGSLYYSYLDEKQRSLVFASERMVIEKFLKRRIPGKFQTREIKQVRASTGMFVSRSDVREFAWSRVSPSADRPVKHLSPVPRVADTPDGPKALQRCTRCILPVTYPMIQFDENGVCNYCHKYSKQVLSGEDALLKILDRYRSKDGSPDCLVGLSGGRDSCYGLHLLKTKYGMSPIAYTYDWGLTTDRARVNQARLCGALGVEHIVRSANLQQKRRCIKKNVQAWYKKPMLGMVPLFMAGDKDFYHYGRQLRSETGISLTVLSAGYQLEQREFFVGFCGIRQNLRNNQRLASYRAWTKARLAAWYGLQYFRNPAYFNESFWDSLRSYMTCFLRRDDFLYLFEYIPWNEDEIESVLQSQYGWESEPAFSGNQWRMGDGQTALINFIFHSVAGFSEFDEFRSNQIREGLLGRQEALELAFLDNQPKWDALEYLMNLVGLDLGEFIQNVERIPKLRVSG